MPELNQLHVADTPPRILIVDDDPMIRALLRRQLEREGFAVDVVGNGNEAIACLELADYDTVVSDIDMPGLSGVELLRAVRLNDLDLPVILVTGDPDVDTAIRAVELGAHRYLRKPVDPEELNQSVALAVKLQRLARLKRLALEAQGGHAWAASDMAGLEARFDRALALLWMAYQPIVSWRDRRVVAFEALVRSGEESMPDPGVLLDVAERLGRVRELSRVVRRLVAAAIPVIPGGTDIFVNLHPMDLHDELLGSSVESLTQYADRVVLEVTERASLEGVDSLERRLDQLRAAGFRIALDDLGAGYAGLNSFLRLRPEVVKLDMGLVQGIDHDPKRCAIVGSILEMCVALESRTIVEGVETEGEARTVASLGADLMQGYYFARPARDLSAGALRAMTELRRL